MKSYSRTMRVSALFVSFVLIACTLFVTIATSANLTPREKLLARRAAKVDALRNLSETIYGLRVDASSTVGNFVLRSDVIRSRLTVAIQGAREIDYKQSEDGTAEVTMEITLGEVETILGRKLNYNQEIIEAVGYGVPPGSGVSQEATFSGDTVSATGYGLPPNEPGLSPVEASLLGFRAAKNDAMRNLAEKINRIQVTSESTVRDFSVQNDDVRTRLRSVLNGARVVSEKKLADSRYEVVLQTNITPLLNLQGQR